MAAEDLEQFHRIRRVSIEQRKHFRMDDPLAGRDPLNVSRTEPRRRAERIRVIDVSMAHDRDGLESAVRMLWKAGYDVAVIHPPAVFSLEVLTDVPARKRCVRSEAFVSRGILVVVICAEKKWIGTLPGKTQWLKA